MTGQRPKTPIAARKRNLRGPIAAAALVLSVLVVSGLAAAGWWRRPAPDTTDAALAVALRFPSDQEALRTADAARPSAEQTRSRLSASESQWASELFTPPAAQSASLTPPEANPPESNPETNGSAPPVAKGNPFAMLNDAQIVSIKKRLNLTADQARHWSPVETALRAIAWKKPPKRGMAPTSIDGDTIEAVMSAARDFIPKLDRNQKTEVRMLVRLLGATDAQLTTMQL